MNSCLPGMPASLRPAPPLHPPQGWGVFVHAVLQKWDLDTFAASCLRIGQQGGVEIYFNERKLVMTDYPPRSARPIGGSLTQFIEAESVQEVKTAVQNENPPQPARAGMGWEACSK